MNHSPQNYKRHIMIHSGEKPFVCEICARPFRLKAHMVEHIKAKH